MSLEFANLIADLLPLAVMLAAGMIIGKIIESFRSDAARKAWRERKRNSDQRAFPNATRLFDSLNSGASQGGKPDVAAQLNKVMSAHFSAQPLLNQSEARLFRELDRMVIGRNPDWQVMAQVSLGEILRSKDKDAYLCINSKRIDLLLVDEACRPRHAIEYQGAGHYQSTAAARDAVKKEALRKAGIGYIEVIKGEMTPSELRRLVDKLVDMPMTDPTRPVSGTPISTPNPQPAG